MKLLFVFFLCCLNLNAQDDENLFDSLLIECYYKSETNSPIEIYDTVDGDIVDSLIIENDSSKFYEVRIKNSQYGWFKIQRIRKITSSTPEELNYENYWVKNTDFFLKLKNPIKNDRLYLYDLPNITSNKIHRLDNYQDLQVIEVSGFWVKVKFKVLDKRIEGWLFCKNY